MKTTSLPLEKTNAFSKLVCDYVAGRTDKQFYNYNYSMDSFKKAIADKNFSDEQRQSLVTLLKRQYPIIESNDSFQPVLKNIELLLDEKTFTITTGHQLNLFTGPLYFVYKILTAINLASELKKKYPANDFVPVYWMATEDHDFEEIKSTRLFGKEITWDKNFSIATGRIPLDGIAEVINRFSEIIGNDTEVKREISLLVEESYNSSANLGSAARMLVHKLFSRFGLVIIDGDSEALKKQFIPVMEDELKNQTSFKLVNETNKKLAAQNYPVRVKPREVNLFYLGNNFRERIIVKNDIAEINNHDISFNVSEMIRLMQNGPQDFSPNVILRPLYQETVLPNIAYVGGPAEVDYWLQLKSLFDYHKIIYPVIVLRNCIMLADDDVRNKMEKFGFSTEDIFMPVDDLIRKYLHSKLDKESSLAEFENAFSTIYNEIQQKVSAVDATLKQTIEAEKHKTKTALKNLEAKLIKAQKQKEEVAINQIKKLKESLFPNGALQERSDNIFQYLSSRNFSFLDTLLEEMDVLPSDFKLIKE